MEEDIVWEEIKRRYRFNGRSKRGGLFRWREEGGQRKENSPGGGLRGGKREAEENAPEKKRKRKSAVKAVFV
jgi:hypothetical protein